MTQANSILPRREEALQSLQSMSMVVSYLDQDAPSRSYLGTVVFKLLSTHQIQLQELLKSLGGLDSDQMQDAAKMDRLTVPTAAGNEATDLNLEDQGIQSFFTSQERLGNFSGFESLPVLMPEDWSLLPFDSFGNLDPFTNYGDHLWEYPDGSSHDMQPDTSQDT